MTTMVLVLHISVALMLIVFVLLQSGTKGASLGAAFGGSSQTVFGSRGPASFMGKITTFAAVVFMITSLTLSIILSKVGTSTLADEIREETAPQTDTIDPFGVPDKALDGAKDSGEPSTGSE